METANTPATHWVAINIYNGFKLGTYDTKELALAAIDDMHTNRKGTLRRSRYPAGEVEVITVSQMHQIQGRIQASQTEEEALSIINYVLGRE